MYKKSIASARLYRIDYNVLGRLFIMFKLTLLLLLLAISQAGAEVFAQRASLHVTNKPLKEVLDELRKKTGFHFLYLVEDLKLANPVNVQLTDAPFAELLDHCFRAQPLTYEIRKNRVLVAKKPHLSTWFEAPPAPQREISGRVTNGKGEPLAGVTVRVKDSSTSAMTDAAGWFRIAVTESNNVLLFSIIGYDALTLPVNGSSTGNVVLKELVSDLEEVVVVGYGTQRRSDMTGAVSSVKADDIRNLPVRSVNEALQGRAAGVQVTRNDGAPGSSSDIVIRGIGSIGGMSPLYIVDGIRMSAGSNFNLQDVASIEVLKDASAASIYGAQAAGGVVLITTKRGSAADKMDINFSADYGMRESVNLFDLLRTPDYYTAKTNFGIATSHWGDPALLPDHDWVNSLYQKGTEQRYSLALSGATAKTGYYLSANYLNEEGTMVDNSFERYGLRSNADFHITDNLTVGETLYAWATATNPTVTNTYPFRSAPVVPLYDDSNPFGGWGKTGSF